MVRCGLPLMSKAILGGTPLPRGLTALSGVSSPPPLTPMVTSRPRSNHDAGGETPPLIGNTHGPHLPHESPWWSPNTSSPIGTHLVPLSHRGEAPTLAPPTGTHFAL